MKQRDRVDSLRRETRTTRLRLAAIVASAVIALAAAGVGRAVADPPPNDNAHAGRLGLMTKPFITYE